VIVRRLAAFAGLLASAAHATPTPPLPVGATVSIRAFVFTPAELVVALGDSVVWTNADPLAHTTASDSSAWSSPELRSGERFVWVASSRGRYPYHCAAHPVMRGVIVVR
jgi:plastocyanin